jgi:hypothetical protein
MAARAQGTGRKARGESYFLSDLVPCTLSLEPGSERSELMQWTTDDGLLTSVSERTDDGENHES